MSTDIQTYCSGPTLKVTRDVTKAEFVSICNLMGSIPEPITEGGFKFINCPGYKSIRFWQPGVQWPLINPETVINDWSTSDEVILSKGFKMTTRLKAFNGAPAFTKKELAEYESIFETIGILMGKIPKLGV